ncbi:hypothetical protein M513_02121 [Trichuris suis]|uniref:Uncharacterized protein n=1 Tax=Trichuris suis TaxID=68888 RepID=A0A085MI18_9BILA|nr:hypothetical protein M513_02121 [Trichuris suis]
MRLGVEPGRRDHRYLPCAVPNRGSWFQPDQRRPEIGSEALTTDLGAHRTSTCCDCISGGVWVKNRSGASCQPPPRLLTDRRITKALPLSISNVLAPEVVSEMLAYFTVAVSHNNKPAALKACKSCTLL